MQLDTDDNIYIVAGGPSLRTFDFEKLEGKQVIAINRAYEVLPSATVLWHSDYSFWLNHKEQILSHSAELKCAGRLHPEREEYPPEITTYKFTGMLGYDEDPNGIRHGNNSGYASIHLAIKLGYTKIRLLGYDFRITRSGMTHWHDGHLDKWGKPKIMRERTLSESMLPHFKELLPVIHEKKIDIKNLNLDSELDTFPFAKHHYDLEE